MTNTINSTETTVVVELWAAPLPKPLTAFAWHHYFVVRRTERSDRYEVWQTQDAGGESMGHVHRNLMPPERGVGGGPASCLQRWNGATAERISVVLADAFTRYPHRDRYLVFPGPNSNTFVAWVLREGNVDFVFDWRAIGSHFR